MSFDVNIGRTQPIIKATASMNNDGGSGGNLGYMMRGRKKDKDKNSKSLFSSTQSTDTFEMASKLPQKDFEESLNLKNSWLENFISRIAK